MKAKACLWGASPFALLGLWWLNAAAYGPGSFLWKLWEWVWSNPPY